VRGEKKDMVGSIKEGVEWSVNWLDRLRRGAVETRSGKKEVDGWLLRCAGDG